MQEPGRALSMSHYWGMYMLIPKPQQGCLVADMLLLMMMPLPIVQEPGSPLSSSHYWGVYMLQEPVSRDKHRVPVSKYEPAVDPSGEHQGLLL
jgi:hypothetical protein